MDTLPAAGLAAGAGYILGSVPFSWLAVRLRTGKDLRTLGSGNVGATNAARALGRGWFPLLFALDFGKGALPVLFADPVFHPPSREVEAWVRVAAGMGAVLGHMFPFWLRFRGGKGVATGAGAVFGMAPGSCAAGLLAFLVAAAVSRFVSLGSVVGAAAAPAAFAFLSRGSPPAQRIPIGAFLLLLTGFVLVKHLPNLRRIAAGTEPRIFGKEPPLAP